MITKATIEAAARAWVLASSGLATGKVIFANQDGPRPAPPYMTVQVMGPRSVGMEDPRAISSLGVQTIYGDREVSVSVQAFGTGAVDLARSSAQALATETTRAQLIAAGCGPRGAGVPEVKDLTGLLETRSEERAQFDATLAFTDTYTDNVGLIEHIIGEGTFRNPPHDDIVVPFAADKS